VGTWVIFYADSGLYFEYMEKGTIVLPRDDFFTCATGLRPCKYTHALYFSSGFATAYSFVLSFPLVRFNFTPAVSCISPCFLLSSRAAQKKGKRSGRAQTAAARGGGSSGCSGGGSSV
jgi:uncharacterized membrane protein YgcG